MSRCEHMIRALKDGEHHAILAELYARDGRQESLERARKRGARVIEETVYICRVVHGATDYTKYFK